MPVPSGNSTEYYDGDGNWTVPAGTGASVDGHVIKDEGVSLPQRASVDFVGAGVTVTNEAGGTQVSISGGITNHGGLTGLGDDGHQQYLTKSGLREWDEQASDPSTPTANKWKLYFKAGGLYLIDDAGIVIGPLSAVNSIVLSAASPRVYTTNSTWTKPVGLDHVIVEVIAGGGAGGGAAATSGTTYSAGGGGGGGGCSVKRIDAASLGATESVTVGAGGTAVSGSNGNNGGTSSFGAHLQASGGSGGELLGAFATSGIGGSGGGGGGASGNVNSYGDAGGPGARSIGSTSMGGNGGGTSRGGGAKGAITASGVDGAVGNPYGGGGSGSANCISQLARAGGAGAAGIVIVWEYVEA
jgi:hypothetical protein